MNRLLDYLQGRHQYTAYEKRVLEYIIKTALSESSKMIIMGLLFRDCLPQYFFALAVMIFLRTSSGGLHFYTYMQCLLVSTLYLFLAIYALPHIPLNKTMILILLMLSIIICYLTAPVTSKYRPPMDERTKAKYRNRTCRIMFYYTLTACIIPDSPYIHIGCWVIILHSLQLIVAKILRKEELICGSTCHSSVPSSLEKFHILKKKMKIKTKMTMTNK